MGKVTRKPQEKHKVSLSPAVSDLVTKISTVPLAELPVLFSGWSQRWPYPRGDLNNWIEPLDRFDDILRDFNQKYGLDQGPQTTAFGVSLIIEHSPGYDEKRLKELGFGPEGDRELVEAILVFSKLLVEKCANRTVYNSTDRLNDLLNTASLSLLHSTLRITFYLAQRYAERTPPAHQVAVKFYDFDHDRLQRLAAPLGPWQPVTAKRGPPSPVKTKSKDKALHPSKARRGSTATNPNDFRSLCKDTATHGERAKASSTPDVDWQSWAHVKVSWSPTPPDVRAAPNEGPPLASEPPSSPTRRRPSASTAVQPETTSAPAHERPRVEIPRDATELMHLEFSAADLVTTSIGSILQNVPDDMPPKAKYELLHQLRVAYGLFTSLKSRKELLAIRLLSIASLANVFNGPELSLKLFPADARPSKAQDLIQQIASLVSETKKSHASVSMYLQTLAMETMSVLAHFKTFAVDINAALGGGSGQGLLSQLIQRGLHDITKDNDTTDTPVGDDWREAIFSMPRTLLEAAGHHGRSSEPVITSAFINNYLSGFNATTGKALRVHLRMLDFIKTFFHHFRDGLTRLLACNAFEVISGLLSKLVNGAWALLQAGDGIPAQYKTRATDYEIPYMHQQIIRSIIDMINDINGGHHGPHADRVLRSLVDSQPLLRAFRLVVDHLHAFGPHTWGEVIKATGGILHSEPTSYTVIAEAGIVPSLLQTVNPTPKQALQSQGRSLTSEPEHRPQGIPPVVDAIVNVAQVFSAICLTNAGFDHFNASGALEKFFEIFESPAHVKVLTDGHVLALLGSVFDELVRHHPNLRTAVLSAVIVMLARVRHITTSLAANVGAGPKLWLTSAENEQSPCGGWDAILQEIIPPCHAMDADSDAPYTMSLPNGDKLLVKDALHPSNVHPPVITDQDEHGLNADNYARPAIAFLLTFFENQTLCTSFLECGGCDLVLDFITLPSQPAAALVTNFHQGMMTELSAAVHMMAETKPHLVLPTLIDRAQYACSELKHFSEYQPSDWSCYFGPLVTAAPGSGSEESRPAAEPSIVEQNGTRIAKALLAVSCFAKVLAEVFNVPLYNARNSQPNLLTHVNVVDMLTEMVRMMGGISAACVREDISLPPLPREIPEDWVLPTQAVDHAIEAGDPQLTTNGRDADADLSGVDMEQAESGDSSATEPSPPSQESQSATFKNIKILRSLLSETPAVIADFMCNLGRSLTGRRRLDLFSRLKALSISQALASAYVTQLEPYFINVRPKLPAGADETDRRFTYFAVSIANVRRSLDDDGYPSSGPIYNVARQCFVVEFFRRAGGLKALTRIGTEFFNSLRSSELENQTFSASARLRACLGFLEELTDSKNIVESAQGAGMRSTDSSKPYYFIPAQVLLNLRMESLPLTRRIWEDDYADQADQDIVQRLVAILKHVLTGDHENEAVQTDGSHPVIPSYSPRPPAIEPQKVNLLKEKGYDEDLAREALFRTNSQGNGIANAEEYCRAMSSNPRRRRLPRLDSTPAMSPAPQSGAASPAPKESHVSATDPSNPSPDAGHPRDEHPTGTDEIMEDVVNANANAQNSAGGGRQDPATIPGISSFSVEWMTAQRTSIREDLADRCNNLLNAHSGLTFELSDLITSAAKKLSDEQSRDYWRVTSDLLVSSLLSMQGEDDIDEAKGKKIGAAAHLVALLIQDGDVFKDTLGVFQESFDGLLSFLRIPNANGRPAEDSVPWVANVLLIVEKMLSRDSEPAEVKWDSPNDLDFCSKAKVTPANVLSLSQKQQVFEALMVLLPRVGKDKSLALAVARIIVILTRDREIASRLSEKRNLQKLFLMAKQLGNGVAHRFQSSFMMILRHIIEDQETLTQIFRSEIKAHFSARNPTRHADVTTYVRELYYLIIRSPDTFVEATNDLVKLSSWAPHAGGSAALILKEGEASDPANGKKTERQLTAEERDAVMQPAASVESPDEAPEDVNKGKTGDLKAPVVEHPDGVIHFILSELLNYKDVEDKEKDTPASVPQGQHGQELTQGSAQAPGTNISEVSKPGHVSFKPEDHPIFSYRCFLLFCLTELLHSYNRTKVELINFSRKADPMHATPSKPRAQILNYLLNGLIPSSRVDKEDSLQFRKRLLTSDWAIRVIVALCSKTGESGSTGSLHRFPTRPQVEDMDDEPDLTFVRRFVLEHAIKSYKDAIASSEPLQMKYSRLLCLSDMFNRLLTKPVAPEGSAGSQNNSYKVLARMMFEKNLTSVLTSSLADIDLSYSGSRRVIKFILRPLQELTTLATHLSLNSPDFINSVLGNTSEDVISSASSVSDVEDDREETPDLFRNSALGLLDPNRDPESDTGTDEEEDDEDEEMYDDEYEDQMEYDNGLITGANDGEAVSDEELEDHLGQDEDIEGLPGDVPMDIELVVDNSHMDIDSEEDDDDEDDESEDDSEDDDDDDDDDEDGEDFEIEEDDDPGEINADDENDSLHEGAVEEDAWEDEDNVDDHGSDDPDDIADIAFGDNALPLLHEPAGEEAGVFTSILRVLGHHDLDGPAGAPHNVPPELIVPSGASVDHADEEDDEEEDDENDDDGDEMDENDEMDYGDFEQFLAGPGFDSFLMGQSQEVSEDFGDRLIWQDLQLMQRPRHFRAHGDHTSHFVGRRLGHRDDLNIMGGRPGYASQHGRSGGDDGTNPLLRRPQSDHTRQHRSEPMRASFMPSRSENFPQLPATIQHVIRPEDIFDPGAHEDVLDAIFQTIHRRERPGTEVRLQFNMGAPVAEGREIPRQPISRIVHRHHTRDEPSRHANFNPALTVTRWQEEARLLFGNTYIEKIQRVQLLLLSILVPPSQLEEKERRRKREEEANAEREEMERLRIEAERRKKETEELEAANAKAEEERQRAEAEAAASAAATHGVDESLDNDDGDTEPMEDIQAAVGASTDEAQDPVATTEAESQPRVFTSIRGRQLDITGLDIDREYLEALPEELREEVIMQQYATRRELARQTGDESSGIDPDFLNALPEDIRDEIRQQEAHAQRRREREAARRQAANTAGAPQAEEMDNDTFLATLDPAFRRVILAEQPPEILRQLDPRHAAEGRAHARRLFHYTSMADHGTRESRTNEEGPQRDSKRQIIQMVDKSGVATILRLMFLPQQGSLRTNLWQILRNICGNRQTRFEVINLLVVVLKEGSTDVNAVERSLANLSLRAKATVGQKTPQPLKRTLSMQPTGGISDEITPLVVVQQCLSALKQLCQNNVHTKVIFLREVDASPASKKSKGKAREERMVKYPINDLVGLLDRKLIVESSSCLQSLAELLSSVTHPLSMLLRKDKDKVTEEPTPPSEDTGLQVDPTTNSASPIGTAPVVEVHQDIELRDAPAAPGSSGSGADAPATPPAHSSEAEEAAASTSANADPDNEGSHADVEESKVKKSFEPPSISEHNLQLVVSIFVAPECNSDTFHSTLETLSSLSRIPGTAVTFSKELINHIKILSQSIFSDLDELIPQLRDAQSISEVQSISSSKFSHGGSDQVKLLRVLQALDYLSAPKTETELDNDNSVAKSILTSSYDDLGLAPLWSKLSECLTTVREKDNITSFATILLPLIESLMVVCKNTSLKDSVLSRQLREQVPGSPVPEPLDELQELFFTFTTEHRKILNDIVRQSPKLMQGNGSFSLLVKNPKVLDFDNKRAYFSKQIHSRLHQQRHIQPPLQLNIRRDQVFLDSYKALYYKSAEEMKYGKLNIRFNGEEGVDAGGVTREWFQVLARGMFNPDWALWQPVAADRTTFHPNPLSWINGEHLLYFKFIGRIIGKALHEGRVLDCHFSRAVYKRLLGKEPNLKDLESMDLDYYKSLQWILENDITDVITEDFSVIEEQFGEEKVVDLIPDGRNIPVTEENKRDYVNAQVRYRLTTSVREQLDNFVRGFHDIIPAELVAIFDEQELELLISGLPEIDVDDWKAHTEYHNYSSSSPQVTWFWRVVRGMSNEERAKLLQFVTGTSKVPLNGFKDLEGMQGTTLFSIHKDPSQSRLPTSHTCFNQLDLPSYDDYDTLKSSLMTAINLGADYFGFA